MLGVTIMLKKVSVLVLVFISLVMFNFRSYTEAASKVPIGVKWGNSILIKGQIGKVTVLKDVALYKLENGKLVTLKTLKKGGEYRVYSYKDQNGGIYGLGGGAFVKKSSSIKYETPSKIKRDQLARLTFFDKEIISNAKKGILKGQPLSLATNDLVDVYYYYDTYPSWTGYYDGGYGSQFGNYIYFTHGEDSTTLSALDWWNDDLLVITPYMIRNTVGTPTSEGISEIDDGWYMYYDLGQYELYFIFNLDNNLKYILLK